MPPKSRKTATTSQVARDKSLSNVAGASKKADLIPKKRAARKAPQKPEPTYSLIWRTINGDFSDIHDPGSEILGRYPSRAAAVAASKEFYADQEDFFTEYHEVDLSGFESGDEIIVDTNGDPMPRECVSYAETPGGCEGWMIIEEDGPLYSAGDTVADRTQIKKGAKTWRVVSRTIYPNPYSQYGDDEIEDETVGRYTSFEAAKDGARKAAKIDQDLFLGSITCSEREGSDCQYGHHDFEIVVSRENDDDLGMFDDHEMECEELLFVEEDMPVTYRKSVKVDKAPVKGEQGFNQHAYRVVHLVAGRRTEVTDGPRIIGHYMFYEQAKRAARKYGKRARFHSYEEKNGDECGTNGWCGAYPEFHILGRRTRGERKTKEWIFIEETAAIPYVGGKRVSQTGRIRT